MKKLLLGLSPTLQFTCGVVALLWIKQQSYTPFSIYSFDSNTN